MSLAVLYTDQGAVTMHILLYTKYTVIYESMNDVRLSLHGVF